MGTPNSSLREEIEQIETNQADFFEHRKTLKTRKVFSLLSGL